jgi:hypothetical protein
MRIREIIKSRRRRLRDEHFWSEGIPRIFALTLQCCESAIALSGRDGITTILCVLKMQWRRVWRVYI